MPKYLVKMADNHELTIEAPNYMHAVELALRNKPGVDVLGYSLAPIQDEPEAVEEEGDEEAGEEEAE